MNLCYVHLKDILKFLKAISTRVKLIINIIFHNKSIFYINYLFERIKLSQRLKNEMKNQVLVWSLIFLYHQKCVIVIMISIFFKTVQSKKKKKNSLSLKILKPKSSLSPKMNFFKPRTFKRSLIWQHCHYLSLSDICQLQFFHKNIANMLQKYDIGLLKI